MNICKITKYDEHAIKFQTAQDTVTVTVTVTAISNKLPAETLLNVVQNLINIHIRTPNSTIIVVQDPNEDVIAYLCVENEREEELADLELQIRSGNANLLEQIISSNPIFEVEF